MEVILAKNKYRTWTSRETNFNENGLEQDLSYLMLSRLNWSYGANRGSWTLRVGWKVPTRRFQCGQPAEFQERSYRIVVYRIVSRPWQCRIRSRYPIFVSFGILSLYLDFIDFPNCFKPRKSYTTFRVLTNTLSTYRTIPRYMDPIICGYPRYVAKCKWVSPPGNSKSFFFVSRA